MIARCRRGCGLHANPVRLKYFRMRAPFRELIGLTRRLQRLFHFAEFQVTPAEAQMEPHLHRIKNQSALEIAGGSRVIAAATHPLRARARLTLDDVLEQSWVMPPADAEPRKRFDAQVHAHGARHARVLIETRSPAAIKALVAQSEILGWLPEPLYAAELAANLLCTLPLPELDRPRHFHVYRRRRNFMAPPVVEFLAALRQ